MEIYTQAQIAQKWSQKNRKLSTVPKIVAVSSELFSFLPLFMEKLRTCAFQELAKGTPRSQ